MTLDEQLLRENLGFIRHRAVQYAANKYGVEDAEELYSASIEKIWRYRDRLVTKTQRAFRSWAGVIVFNTAKDMSYRRVGLIHKVDTDVAEMILEKLEGDVQELHHHYDRERLLKYIHSAYGNVAYMICRRLEDGYRYTDLPEDLQIARHTLYRTLTKIRRELKILKQ